MHLQKVVHNAVVAPPDAYLLIPSETESIETETGADVGKDGLILVPEVEDGKIDLVVDDIVEGVSKCPEENLFIEADWDEFALGIAVLFVLHHTPPVGEGS